MMYLKQTNTSDSILDIVIADYYQSLRGLIIDIMRADKEVRKKPLKIVTNQIILRKDLFLKNPNVSKKEIYFIHLLSRLPKIKLAVYHLRNLFLLNSIILFQLFVLFVKIVILRYINIGIFLFYLYILTILYYNQC